MSESRYVVRPKADRDLEDQAFYYANRRDAGKVAIGFWSPLTTPSLFLATQPNMGWQSRLKRPELKTLRVFRVKDFERILILYIPLLDGVEILRVVHGSRNLQALLRREGLD